MKLMCVNPRERFKLPVGDGFSVWNLEKEFTVDTNEFLSKGRATPFEGMKLFGVNMMTVYNGKTVYRKDIK